MEKLGNKYKIMTDFPINPNDNWNYKDFKFRNCFNRKFKKNNRIKQK
jgi:hypothetical protein